MKSAQPIILNGLTLKAGGQSEGRMLFRQLSLTVRPGERWVILGPNGAGKTTLLLALTGLLTANGGEIVLGNRLLADWPASELARERAWCPQFWFDPFPVAAWESVATALVALNPHKNADEAEREARKWLAAFDVARLADADVRALSGGERQRVALATTYAQDAPIVLLDEPAAHLDWPHQALLQKQVVQHAVQGGTVLAVVHDLNLAWSMATHALLFDGQGGAYHGTRETVMTAEQLSLAYGLAVQSGESDGHRWFRAAFE